MGVLSSEDRRHDGDGGDEALGSRTRLGEHAPGQLQACDTTTCNQAQVSSQSSPGGVLGLSERLLEAAQLISQRKLAVLKALRGREGSNVGLSCSAGWRDKAAGKAGVERRQAAHAADSRQVDVLHLS